MGHLKRILLYSGIIFIIFITVLVAAQARVDRGADWDKIHSQPNNLVLYGNQVNVLKNGVYVPFEDLINYSIIDESLIITADDVIFNLTPWVNYTKNKKEVKEYFKDLDSTKKKDYNLTTEFEKKRGKLKFGNKIYKLADKENMTFGYDITANDIITLRNSNSLMVRDKIMDFSDLLQANYSINLINNTLTINNLMDGMNYLDPTIILGGGNVSADGSYSSAGWDGTGAVLTIKLDTNGGPPTFYSTFIKWNISEIPSTAIITSAIVNLYTISGSCYEYWHPLDLACDWNETSHPGSCGVGSLIADPNGNPGINQYYATSITSAFNSSFSTNNTLYAIRITTPSNPCTTTISSREGGNAPYLNITYANFPSVVNESNITTRYYGVESNITVNVTDPESDQIMWVNFTVKAPNTSVIINNINGTNTSGFWVSPNFNLTNGSYQIFINASDNTTITTLNYNITISYPVITLSPTYLNTSLPSNNATFFNLNISTDNHARNFTFNYTDNCSAYFNVSYVPPTTNVGNVSIFNTVWVNTTGSMSGNYSCTMFVNNTYDGYLTNFPLFVNVTNNDPSFLSSNFSNFYYANTINISVTLNDSEGDELQWVNFTLTAPNGTNIINNVNGTNLSKYVWYSGNFTLTNGTYQVAIWAKDTDSNNNIAAYLYNVTILDNVSMNMASKTFNMGTFETKTFLVNLTHESNQNFTFNWSDNCNDSYFNITYLTNPLQVNYSENRTQNISVQTLNAPVDNYNCQVQVNKTYDNHSITLQLYLNVGLTNAVMVMYQSDNSTPCAGTGCNINNAMTDAQTSNSSPSWYIWNNGNLTATGCNASLSGFSSFANFSITNFNLSPDETKNLYLTYTTPSAATYTGYVNVTCVGFVNGSTVSLSTGNKPYAQLLVTSTVVPVGPGGGGTITNNIITMSVVDTSACNLDGVCQPERAESTVNCQCQADQNNQYLCGQNITLYGGEALRNGDCKSFAFDQFFCTDESQPCDPGIIVKSSIWVLIILFGAIAITKLSKKGRVK